MATTAATRRWTGPRRSRRAISTTARSRSTAAPTRSSATSSPRPCWGCERRRAITEVSSPAKAGDPVRRGGRAYEQRPRLLDPRLRGDDEGISGNGGGNSIARSYFWRDGKMDFDLSEEQRLL